MKKSEQLAKLGFDALKQGAPPDVLEKLQRLYVQALRDEAKESLPLGARKMLSWSEVSKKLWGVRDEAKAEYADYVYEVKYANEDENVQVLKWSNPASWGSWGFGADEKRAPQAVDVEALMKAKFRQLAQRQFVEQDGEEIYWPTTYDLSDQIGDARKALVYQQRVVDLSEALRRRELERLDVARRQQLEEASGLAAMGKLDIAAPDISPPTIGSRERPADRKYLDPDIWQYLPSSQRGRSNGSYQGPKPVCAVCKIPVKRMLYDESEPGAVVIVFICHGSVEEHTLKIGAGEKLVPFAHRAPAKAGERQYDLDD